MPSLAMALPILPGKTEAVRKLFKTAREEKWKEYEQSQRRAGIKRERDFLQSAPTGDMFIFYVESDDFNKAFKEIAMSKDPFDVWFKDEMKNATGLNPSQASSVPLPEQLMQFDT